MDVTSKPEITTETQAGHCEKHGAFESTRLVMGSRSQSPWSKCDRCHAERDAAEAATKAAEAEAQRVLASGVPRRHRAARIDTYHVTLPAQGRAVEALREYRDNFAEHAAAGRCLLFYGKTGTGKTHLACALVTELSKAGKRAHYTTLADMLSRIRATWKGQSGETEMAVLKYFRDRDLLVIDEAGMQYGTDAERVQVNSVVDARYRDMRPTIVITNCDREQLKEYLGERVLSRLRENGGKSVVFDWQDQRGRTA